MEPGKSDCNVTIYEIYEKSAQASSASRSDQSTQTCDPPDTPLAAESSVADGETMGYRLRSRGPVVDLPLIQKKTLERKSYTRKRGYFSS